MSEDTTEWFCMDPTAQDSEGLQLICDYESCEIQCPYRKGQDKLQDVYYACMRLKDVVNEQGRPPNASQLVLYNIAEAFLKILSGDQSSKVTEETKTDE